MQRGLQLGKQLVELDERGFGLAGPIDLAIDAIEIANLVGIQIHPDRNSPATAAENRIDEPVGLERPLVQGVQRVWAG